MKRSETKTDIINLISSYSREFGIAPQFVEKDIYVVKVLSELSKINYPDLKIVFSGGTCLSKAYNKIQRFSEDIDFRLHATKDFSRENRKKFYNFILEKLSKLDECKIIESSIKKGNENKFLSFEMEHEKLFESSFNLRPNIKVEFTFENLILPTKVCSIKPFLFDYLKDLPSTEIECIQPSEVIANKFSALMWRVFIKDRSKDLHTKENDPTIVRHLHDISALEDEIFNTEFINLLDSSFDNDKGRGGIERDYTLIEFAKITLDKLMQDKIYKQEYRHFVDSMSYAKTDEVITFEKAIESFKNVMDFIEVNSK
ncbi:MAG: nucleotidyl transferase AbiEii/AbiGii toxin family protein [Candidatus Gastranaerophilales bacterium]|nr:nucleotidyl transferase AbiEii/AbiGii toxin family protein [Candidatus Gastranaerophilales bacterium]